MLPKISGRRVMKLKDMTAGNPFKTILIFVLPMILSVTLQQLYNIADNVIAGNFINNSYSFSAVGTVYPVTVVFLDIAVGFGVGCGITIARYFGAQDYKRVKSALNTGLIFMTIIAVVVTAIGLAVMKPLLSVMIDGASEPECFNDAYRYMMIYVAGMFFLFVYNVCMNVFQALGNSKIPLYFLIFSTVFNIGLDILFVKVCDMEADGLALGTVISEAVASMLSLFVLIKSVRRLCREKVIAFDKFALKDILHIGIPSILQGTFISVGGIFIMAFVSKFGDIYVSGGYSAAYKVCYMAINIFNVIGNAISTFVSQNIGAKKYERLYKGFFSGFILSFAFLAIATTLILPLKEFWIKLFLSSKYKGNTQTVMATGELFITIVVPFFALIAIKSPCDGILKGSGDMLGFMTGTGVDLVLRVVLAYVFGRYLGYKAIFWAWPIGWAVGAMLSLCIFLFGKWKYKCGFKIKLPPCETEYVRE